MRKQVVLAALLALMITVQGWAMTPEQRRQYLDKVLHMLPDSPTFNAWLQKSGELPPDFDALPRINGLPDPLKFLDGKPVRTVADWRNRRAEIWKLYVKYILGTFPPKPKIDRAVVLDETQGKGYLVRNVRLEFGPQSKGTIRVRVVIPDGKGPFPVLVGTSLTGWAPLVLRRGYIACGYAGNDTMDDAAPLEKLYPDYEFAELPRRAWAATVVLDYLQTLPQVDMKRVAIWGGSRDGKAATIAAAMDERFAALLGVTTGVGGVIPWRLSGERGYGEGIETFTRMFPTWFVPRLRFFAGREDRLPVDGNLLTAMVAPRAVLLENGQNDEVTSPFGSEQVYVSAIKVYRLLGQPSRLGVLRFPGFHGANDPEVCLDWLDIQFGRSAATWTNNFLFPWDFDKWRVNAKETVDLSRYPKRGLNDILTAPGGGTIASTADWEKKSAQVRKAVEWMLGEEPPMMPPTGSDPAVAAEEAAAVNPNVLHRDFPPSPLSDRARQVTPDLVAVVTQLTSNIYSWLDPQKSQTSSRSISFGSAGIRGGRGGSMLPGLKGDLYYPANTPANAKLPTVIWLHGYGYPLGYMWNFRFDLHPILALVQAGYAVMAFDQTGFGSRMNESGPFYDRYPHWSRMGRQVEDVRAAIDALQKDSLVDPQRIYLFGYSMGGTVGLYSAALDERVKGVVSICGFTPMRTDTADRGTGGVARYSHELGLIPRLGFFIGHEAQIPYDFHEVLGAIAPRPVLVLEPELDRDANVGDVGAAVEQAKKVYSLYGAADALALHQPWDYNRLTNEQQGWAIDWMKKSFH
jgi:pimeloyl-ACP methyl ester carboxylesterase